MGWLGVVAVTFNAVLGGVGLLVNLVQHRSWFGLTWLSSLSLLCLASAIIVAQTSGPRQWVPAVIFVVLFARLRPASPGSHTRRPKPTWD